MRTEMPWCNELRQTSVAIAERIRSWANPPITNIVYSPFNPNPTPLHPLPAFPCHSSSNDTGGGNDRSLGRVGQDVASTVMTCARPKVALG